MQSSSFCPLCLFHFSLYTILCTFNYIVYREYSNFFVVSLIMQPIYPREIYLYKILTGRSHPYCNLSRLFISLCTLNNNKLFIHPVATCILYINMHYYTILIGNICYRFIYLIPVRKRNYFFMIWK